MSNACYQCGSPEGDASRLCPACNAQRMQERQQRTQGPGSDEQLSAVGPGFDAGMGSTSYIKYGLFGLLGLSLLYFLTFASAGPGLLVSNADKVYRDCMQVQQKMFDSRPTKQIDTSGMDEFEAQFAQGMEEAMQELAQGFGAGMCELYKKVCEKSPRGRDCRGAKAQIRAAR